MPTPEITSQIIATTSCHFPQSPSHYSIRTPQIVGHTFLEPQQYLAAIPVQPTIIPTIPFATAPSIIPAFSVSIFISLYVLVLHKKYVVTFQ